MFVRLYQSEPSFSMVQWAVRKHTFKVHADTYSAGVCGSITIYNISATFLNPPT